MRRVLAALLLVILAGYSACAVSGARAGGMPSATLSLPLRFVQPMALGAMQAERVDVRGDVASSPVTLSGGEVAGSPGAVPPGSAVSVLWRGVEVGRAVAASDGSFRAAVPVLPDSRVSVVYGDNLPELKPWVNVAAYVYPNSARQRVRVSLVSAL